MKHNNKAIGIMAVGIILGICFAAYLLYDQKGYLRKTEYFILGITLLLGILMSTVVIKIANKK
jgi:hypothetical protein